MGSHPITYVDEAETVDRGRSVSPISNLPSPIRLLVRAIACVPFMSVVAGAQDIGPVTFRDSLVMRQMVYRTPCPTPVPRAWGMVDSTLGRLPRCSLVETAARAISQFQQMRPPVTGPADPWNPLCVRVVVGRNTGSTGLPGDWLVVFDLAVNHQAWVVIDRQSGEVGNVSFGHGSPDDRPRCMGRG